jgi:uncharacterized protein
VLSMIVSATTALFLIPTLLTLHVPRCLRGEKGVARPTLASGVPVAAAMLSVGLASVVVLWSASVQAQAPSADELMLRSYQANRLDSSLSNATFRLLSSSGQERVRKTYGATKLASDGQLNRRVVRFLSPTDVRNTTSLLIENSKGEDEIWVYLPALKKARRIAGSGKKGSFFGTDLSYGDVVGHKPDAWKHRWLREEQFQGQACDVVESLPASAAIADESGYSKRISWLARPHHMALKVEMLDSGGAPLKTVLSSELKLVDPARGKWQAMKLEAKNTQTGHATFISMERFEANVALAEDMFSQRYLEKEE